MMHPCILSFIIAKYPVWVHTYSMEYRGIPLGSAIWPPERDQLWAGFTWCWMLEI